MTAIITPHPSSYRDPSGFIFEKERILYRQVNLSFKDHFDHFIQSGCYKHLVERGLLVPHETINGNFSGDKNCYLTLRPERVPFISYPYEWTFDMLKDAALLTLQLVRESLQFGIILKDATPYNIQWLRSRLTFIDTLSFEKYEEVPWIAYRQFCECFLGPLLLMHYSKKPLQQLQLAWPDGIPLEITRSLLPKRTRFSLHIYLHIHLHAKMASKKKTDAIQVPHFSRQKLLNIISSLENLVSGLHLPAGQTTWSGYYKEAGQRDGYLEEKKQIIAEWLDQLTNISTAVDLGANEGAFSQLAASKNIRVLASDADAGCINHLYTWIKSGNEKNIQPLITDLSNPGPANGVNNEERSSFISRVKADLVMALALVHHLAIGKNIPFNKIASLFAMLGRITIVEYVPKTDKKIVQMLAGKKDVYENYSEDHFVDAFTAYFEIIERKPVKNSERILFLLKRK